MRRCRDVLWCHSHLVGLVFECSIPTCACFHSENGLATCFFFFRNGKNERTEVGGGPRERDAWSIKYESIELCLLTKNKPLL